MTAQIKSGRKGSTTHGQYGSPAYRSWAAMLDRCRRPKSTEYKYYGGRGIRVCKRWYKFENFYADMGPRPSGHSIERKNSNGNYTPRNCIWATSRQQTRNKRNSRFIEFRGHRMVISDWETFMGLPSMVLRRRLYRGWGVEDAILTPHSKQLPDAPGQSLRPTRAKPLRPLMYRFQVICEIAGHLEPVDFEAEDVGKLQERIQQAQDRIPFRVLDIGPGQPCLNPGRFAFSREEFAARLGVPTSRVNSLLAEGVLKTPKSGLCRFTSATAEKLLGSAA